MRTFLKTVAWCAEKAACLARACRKEKDLFQLLVEEKNGDQKGAGARGPDFKTLADVLIQETVRHDLGMLYPDLRDHIMGEESNEFTNTLGEKIKVRVCDTQDQTSELLCRVLDGHRIAADLLAKEVHSTFDAARLSDLDFDVIPEEDDRSFTPADLGIWIDPIDATFSYVRGKDLPTSDSEELPTKGLEVVTILIGVFERSGGVPVAGVLNKPFARLNPDTQRWSGQLYWGLTLKDGRRFNSEQSKPSMMAPKGRMKIVVSIKENNTLLELLNSSGVELVRASGAGYKVLLVITGLVDLYVNSKASTYKWDTCSGHAILNSLGGGISDLITERPLTYNEPLPGTSGAGRWSNHNGFIAYRTVEDLEKIKVIMSQFLQARIGSKPSHVVDGKSHENGNGREDEDEDDA